MNLIFVGSCLESSALARGLNNKLSNSLVYRHDLLASLKNIPLDSTDNPDSRIPNVGDYLGDIEAIDPSRVEKGTLDTLKTTFEFLAKSRSTAKVSFEQMLVKESLNKFSKRVVAFDSVSLSVVNIFSGIINKKILSNLISEIDNTIIINMSNNTDKFFDINITEQDIENIIEEKNKGIFLGTFKSINELLSSDEFTSLFSDFKEEKEVKQQETKKAEEANVEAEDVGLGAGITANTWAINTTRLAFANRFIGHAA